MKKRICMFLTAMLIMTAAGGAATVTATVTLSGDGSDGSPYLITSAEELLAIDEAPYIGNYTRCFQLENDIVLQENEFLTVFTGKFNGNGKTITIDIDTSSDSGIGLFSEVTYGSEIKNLKVKGTIKASASLKVGGIAGTNGGGNKIENCESDVNITVTTTTGSGGVGGIMGYAGSSNVTISNCVNTGNISTPAIIAGGIIGYANMSVAISESRNYGNITTTGWGGYAGGIAGDIRNTSSITLSSNYGNISANTSSHYVGGISGYNNNVTIDKSFNAGTVTNTNGKAGGIMGGGATLTVTNSFNKELVTATGSSAAPYAIAAADATVSFCYNIYPNLPLHAGSTATSEKNYNITGAVAETGTTSKTDAELQAQGTYEDWNFTDIWEINDIQGYLYPQLKGNPVEMPDTGFASGTGTQGDPFIIETAEEFMNIKDNPGKYFKLSDSINAPIVLNAGDYIPQFTGSLNGNGKTVKVNISYSSQEGVGLFGKLTGFVEITNLTVDGAVVGGTRVGGLFGWEQSLATNSKIENCVNLANVSGTSQVGGIGGRAFDTNTGVITFTRLTNCGTITSTSDYVGGIFGIMRLKATYSKNTGTITGNNAVGGIIGWSYGDVDHCYNIGDIHANSQAGGIIGLIQGGERKIENSYNTAAITANFSFGGIIGQVVNGDSNILRITYCYNVGNSRNSSEFNPIAPSISKTAGDAPRLFETNTYHITPSEEPSTYGSSEPLTANELKSKDLGTEFSASSNGYPYPQINNLINEVPSPTLQVLTITKTGNGTVNHSRYVENGKNTAVRITPDENNVIEFIKLDDEIKQFGIGGVYVYQTPEITEDVTLAVSFVPSTANGTTLSHAYIVKDENGYIYTFAKFIGSVTPTEYGVKVNGAKKYILSGEEEIAKTLANGLFGIGLLDSQDLLGDNYTITPYISSEDGEIVGNPITVDKSAAEDLSIK